MYFIKIAFFLASLVFIISCEDLYVNTIGNGNCTQNFRCSFSQALSKIQESCDSVTLHIANGEYQLDLEPVTVECTKFVMTGEVKKGFRSPLLSFDSHGEPLLTFNKSADVTLTQLTFNIVRRVLISSTENSLLHVTISSSNFTEGESTIVKSSTINNFEMDTVFLDSWSHGFIEIEDSKNPISFTVKNVQLVGLLDQCPFIMKTTSSVTADFEDFKIDDSENFNHATAGIQISGGDVTATLTRFTLTDAMTVGIDIQSLKSTKLTIKDKSSFSKIQNGAILVRAESATLDIENSEFKQNSITVGGGSAISVIYNTTITYTSTNNKFEDNSCTLGGGGAIFISQFVGGSNTPTSITLTQDHYERNIAKGYNGGAIFLDVKKLQLTVSKTKFLNNIAKYQKSTPFVWTAGGMFVKSEDWMNVEMDNLVVRNNNGSNGGGFVFQNYVNNYPDSKSITFKDSNFSSNKAELESSGSKDTGFGGVFYFNTISDVSTKPNTISIVLKNNNFEKNIAGANGGVISVQGVDDPNFNYDVQLTQNRFISNTAGLDGGACDISKSKVAFRSNQFDGNVGQNGGAVSLMDGKDVDFWEYNSFKNNIAICGGAIYASNIDSLDLLKDNVVEKNSASSGGGLNLHDVRAVNIKSPISHNSAVYGGGMYLFLTAKDTVKLYEKVTGNTANYFGGGVYVDGDVTKDELDNLKKFVVGNLGGNLMSPPISMKKRTDGQTKKNVCAKCHSMKDWCCQVFDLQFSDLFGDVLTQDTMDPFLLTFQVDEDPVVIPTQSTGVQEFSFTPKKILSGAKSVNVEFQGVMISIEIVFGKVDDGKPSGNYLWILYVVLGSLFFLCCCCCFMVFAACFFGVCVCCIFGCFAIVCLKCGVLSGLCCGCWTMAGKKDNYKEIVDHREQSINKVATDEHERVSILRKDDEKNYDDEDEDVHIVIDRDEIEENIKQTEIDQKDGDEHKGEVREYIEGYDEL